MSGFSQDLNADDSYLWARRCVLTALYLPGLARPISPKRSGSSQVLRTLLVHPCEIGEAQATLEAAGLWEPALCLSHPGLLAHAEKLVESTRVLTMACAGYPSGWSRIGSPPPALWLEGDLPEGSSVGVVGSREPPPASRDLAFEVAQEAVHLGHSVVSGGAPGCDWQAGVGAGSSLIEILPCGIGQKWGVGSGCRLSAREPGESFSSAAAMERNALIYAFGLATVLCHARFKTGGAWVGSTDALRRRLCRLIVWVEEGALASRALIALGGIPLARAEDLKPTLEAGSSQCSLFG